MSHGDATSLRVDCYVAIQNGLRFGHTIHVYSVSPADLVLNNRFCGARFSVQRRTSVRRPEVSSNLGVRCSCGAGTLACSAETHLGIAAFSPDALPDSLERRHECLRFEFLQS